MKVICEKSMHPIRIHNGVTQWVYCPSLVKKKIQKINVDSCKECRFFIDIVNTEFSNNQNAFNIRIHSIGIRPGFKPRKYKNNENKTIYKKVEFKAEFVPLIDVFDEKDKVRILVQIPLCYVQKEIKLEYENKELVIQAGNYKQHIPIKNDLTIELTGDVKVHSLMNGIINIELEKDVRLIKNIYKVI